MADAVGRGLRVARSAPSPCRISCHGSRTPPRRRHHRARAGLGQVRCRSMLGLCEGRPPLRRLRSASGNVRFARAIEGASIRRRIWPTIAASSRPMPSADTPNSTSPSEVLGLSGPACWVHARRPFFAMADLEENARRKAAGKREIALSPIGDRDRGGRIDALFAIERSINGQSADHRKAVRQARRARRSSPIWKAYMREQCAKLSRGHDLAKAMNYMFKRWGSFTMLSSDDGRVCLSNNAAGRAARHLTGQKVVVILAGPTAEGVGPPPCIASSSPRR